MWFSKMVKNWLELDQKKFTRTMKQDNYFQSYSHVKVSYYNFGHVLMLRFVGENFRSCLFC